jgi:hypothetical protein
MVSVRHSNGGMEKTARRVWSSFVAVRRVDNISALKYGRASLMTVRPLVPRKVAEQDDSAGGDVSHT